MRRTPQCQRQPGNSQRHGRQWCMAMHIVDAESWFRSDPALTQRRHASGKSEFDATGEPRRCGSHTLQHWRPGCFESPTTTPAHRQERIILGAYNQNQIDHSNTRHCWNVTRSTTVTVAKTERANHVFMTGLLFMPARPAVCGAGTLARECCVGRTFLCAISQWVPHPCRVLCDRVGILTLE